MTSQQIYDTIIIGAGPAGMAAAIYAARAELSFCLIDRSYAPGGQVLSTGTPQEVAKSRKGYTPKYIREELK